ncbi:MAG: xanthine dehydrogenase family protein subunit M [Bacteroidia bacterium]
MIPNNFEYHRPDTLEEAIRLLNELGDEAKILAGGHSLIPTLKLRLNDPEHLIDIGHLKSLRYIRQEGNEIAIGANSTHSDVAFHALIDEHLPLMAQAGKLIGDVQVRNRGTIGGSIAHADPAADWPATLLTTEATVVMQGSGGKRSVAAGDFFMGLYYTALEEGEIVTEIRIPIPPAGTRSAYLKFMQPASRFAIVGCAVMITGNGTCDDVRVAFNGVSSTPFRDTGVESALKGKPANHVHIEAAAAHAANGKSVMSDHFASEDYRTHLAKVYARKALQAAAK